MDLNEYERMFRLEEAFWWFRGRRAVVYPMLERHSGLRKRRLRILDLGCGTGKTLKDFEALGHEVIGADFSPEALRFTRGRGAHQLVRADACELPFRSGSFDLVVAMDIMEHVRDDDAMAREIRRVLRPDGHALIHVPAHPFLWGAHDITLHHFRRYTASQFRGVLRKAKLRPVRFTPSICLLYPIAAAVRLIQRIPGLAPQEGTSYPLESRPILSEVLYQIIRLEASLIRRIDMPFGLSILAVVRKK